MSMATSKDPSNQHGARKPSDADRFVGTKLRQGRREMSLTQDGLANLIGVTFQQIQKYEAGHSRLSAGRLRDAAIALKKPITFFYEPFDHPVKDGVQAREKLLLRDLKREAKKAIDNIKNIDDLKAANRVLSALKED